MLHLQLLGPLLVQDDEGNDLTPPGARERNGLATLAVVSPDPLSTDRIALELYREQHTNDPRNAVQAMISRLRRGLGQTAGSIETTTTGYRLVDVSLDVDEAERLLQATIAEQDPAAAMALLAEAQQMWHGPTLDGLSGELVETERLRIDSLRADAEDAVFELRLSVPDDQTLGAALEAAVRDQPLRERRWELLMRTLYREGRQADALRAFQRARTLLSSHLGLEPGPALTSLEQQILSHDPALNEPEFPDPTPDGAHDSAATSPSAATTVGPPLPSGTLTVLLCDVEGSVLRWESDPDDTAREIAELHRLWGEATEAWGGHVIKSTGDGVLSVFGTASSAIQATVQAMRAQLETSLMVKAALHTGTLHPVEDDYRGPVINRCARLLDVAHGGQILISGTTAELAKSDPALAGGENDAGIELRELGTHWLRDVAEPILVSQVQGPGLRTSFPPLQSAGPVSLPRLRSELLGRADLTEEVQSRVGEHKLVTLLGPGGIGKTSTALAVAWELSGGRGMTFVDLARVSEPAAVEDRLLDAVVNSDHDDSRNPVERIADRLRATTDLVIIDNAEHVLDAVSSLVDQVLQYELKGSFLVTSRQPLGIPDEFIIGVPPLALPGDGDDLGTTGRSPSVQLFVERAKASRPDIEIQSGLLPVVAHICRRLDGLPLAIELAAGRASVLSIDDIAARLDDQLRLLRQVRTQRDRRHQSLEVVVGWSAEQLSQDAAEIFQRLSVMAGSFGIDGVERVLRWCGLNDLDALEAIDELHEASLLTVEPGGSRFRMLEPIRQVAAAQLQARDLERETRWAHARWMIDLATDAHNRRDVSRIEAMDRLDAEADQLVAATVWIGETGEAELAPQIAFAASWWFLTRDARLGERVLRRLVDIVDADSDPVGWALTILGLGIATAAHPQSEVEESSLEAVAILDDAEHPDRGLARLAAAFAQIGGQNTEVPLQLLEEADRLISSDDLWARAVVDMAAMAMQSLVLLSNKGDIDPEPIIARGQRAIAVLRQVGEKWALGVALGELGRLLQTLERLEEAEACYEESLQLFSGSDYHGSHYVLSELGRMATSKGQHAKAARYHDQSLQLASLDGNAGCMAMSLAGLGHAAEAREELNEALEYYERASSMSKEASLIEHGHDDWRLAIERIQSQLGSPPAS
jgi:predicted ATPase/class 3 adenylate cyclase